MKFLKYILYIIYTALLLGAMIILCKMVNHFGYPF